MKADYQGHVAELLAKATNQKARCRGDDRGSGQPAESLREWGALDKNFAYVKGATQQRSARLRAAIPAAGSAAPVLSEPVGVDRAAQSGLWAGPAFRRYLRYADGDFQPVGGMGMVGQAFARELGPLIRYNAKVVDIHQDEHGVSATYEDTRPRWPRKRRARTGACAPYRCRSSSQIPMKVGAPMAQAIAAVPYCAGGQGGSAIQAPLLGSRTNRSTAASPTPICRSQHRLSQHRLFRQRQGRPAGRLHIRARCDRNSPHAPQERVTRRVEYGSQIHPQYRQEFENGVAVAWHRLPFTHGLLRHVDR